MSVRVEVQPELLEWARVRSRIADDDWNRRFPAYESWLAGSAVPTLKQLESFARRAHAPIGYFFLDQPPVEVVPIPDFRTIGASVMGSSAPPSADLLDTIYACQARQEWYRHHQLQVGEAPVEFVASMTVDVSVMDAAAQIRVALNWTTEVRRGLKSADAALTELRERAESVGVLVMISGIVGSNTHRRLDAEEFRGFALADSFAPLVFVNGADSKSAQLFTLAHELAHVWLGATALSDVAVDSQRRFDAERWCNEVAAELLVPMTEFRDLIDPSDDQRTKLDRLAAEFCISTQVILGRLREIGLLTWSEYMSALAAEQRRAADFVASRSSGGNYYNTKSVYVSKRFARALISSTFEGRTTYSESFRLLDMTTTKTLVGLGQQLGVL